MAAPSTAPGRGGTFRLTDRELGPDGRAEFAFDLDGESFVERAHLPEPLVPLPPGAVDLLLDVCHLAMGTSYFKLSAPRRLVVERPVQEPVARLAGALYDEGLREMAYRNGLPVPLPTELVWHEAGRRADDHRRVAPGRDGGTGPGTGLLVPVGGGKDSAAALALLTDAVGFTVSPTPAHFRQAAAAHVPLLSAERVLDPRLEAASGRPGAFNGHIPVTAVNSVLGALVAAGQGLWGVAMGNERSANEPTVLVDGTPVNHQYSKSLGFERLLSRALAEAGVGYFSVLRQLSELAIAGMVAGRPELHRSFLSCNRAFRRARPAEEEQTWCLECPKCRFTFLCFAVFMSPEQAEVVFGGNPLADSHAAEGFAGLWDGGAKPFDCVGERAESAAAMAWLGQARAWRDLPVVKELAGPAAAFAVRSGTTVEDLLEPQGPHLAPADLADLVARAAKQVQPRR
jgi:hypothetical protein